MLEVYRQVRLAARSDLPVVIVGETGTGKELVARALHQLGPAACGPFVDVNCAAVPETLAEAEFFGWQRGAFTGAYQETVGLLEAAAGGTLFLDEACSLPVGLQARLLRAIEQGGFRRVGGRRAIEAKFRIVAAVAEPPRALIDSKRMREDFAYRISGISIVLPPLRQRGRDIQLLAEHFLKAANGNGDPPKILEQGALDLLRRHPWPGNVRELRMAMKQAAVLFDRPSVTASDLAPVVPSLRDGLDERTALRRALEAHGWNVTRTAQTLGKSRTTVHSHMRRFALQRPAADARPVFS
jgi:DNA-binding NtrC family response regulator